VFVVAHRLHVVFDQPFFNVAPNLTVLEIRVKLDDLNHLLFGWSELVKVKTASVESSKDNGSQVLAFSKIVHVSAEI
jgi:hypothetical protein